MTNKDPKLNNEDIILERLKEKPVFTSNSLEDSGYSGKTISNAKWINNKGEEVKQVFGFNDNAELVNGRVAMIGFLMLILTELAFAGAPATQKIFGIN